MEWYWIVLIIVAACVFISFASAFVLFSYAFAANRKAVARVFRKREADPAPLVRMRFATKDRMDALPHETWSMTSGDGLKLSAKFFPNGGTNRVAAIFHGWHSFPWWDFGKTFDILYDAGYAVLAVFERAQGDSEGKYMTYGAKESDDLLLWVDRILERFGGIVNIAIMGVSMGAATVLCATGKNLPEQVRCAVSDCAFTSAKDQFGAASKGKFKIARAMSEPVVRLFAKIRYADTSAIGAVGRSHTPTLFIHGDADDFVPYAMMRQLYDACAAPEKELWTSPDAVHAEAAMTNPVEYAAHVLPFLKKHL